MEAQVSHNERLDRLKAKFPAALVHINMPKFVVVCPDRSPSEDGWLGGEEKEEQDGPQQGSR